MKIQNDITILAKEIQTVYRMNDIVKKNQEKIFKEVKISGVPNIVDMGTIILQNFEQINEDET